jgi:hypothetical protein
MFRGGLKPKKKKGAPPHPKSIDAHVEVMSMLIMTIGVHISCNVVPSTCSNGTSSIMGY